MTYPIDDVIAIGDPDHVAHHVVLADSANDHETRLVDHEARITTLEDDFADVIPTRQTVDVVTGSLVPNARYSGLVVLGATYHLIKIQASGPARVRLYDTPDHRDADVGRPVGTDPDPTIDHGVMVDFKLDVGGVRTISPQVIGVGYSGDDIPILIDNIYTSSAVITVTLTFRKLE